MTSSGLTLGDTGPGLIKVKLFFKTWEPKHLRSHVLKTEFAAKGPYLEDVCVLLPQAAVTPDLTAFQATFRELIHSGAVGRQSTLVDFLLLIEDHTTLAYVMETPQ